MKGDLASKAADFICDAFYCQGGMFYAGTILLYGSKASLMPHRPQAY